MNGRSEPVAKALALDGDAERIKDYYRDWASTYDADVGEEGYHAPDIVAALARLLTLSYLETGRDQPKVMDAGCGTGLSGVALARAGFSRIDGFDIAPEMVEAAQATGAYGQLLSEIDLNAEDAGLSAFAGGYDMVACVGVFTLGHVAPRGLDHLIAITRPGGFLVVSTRADYLKRSDFRDYSDELERRGAISLVQSLADARYVGGDRADYWVFRKEAERA